METAKSLLIGVSIGAAGIQLSALLLQQGEHRQAAICDADHLSAIQSTMMQYIGLYITLVAANQRGLSFMLSQPSLVWVGVALLFPFIGLVVYPSHGYLTPIFLFLGGLGVNVLLARLLQMKPVMMLV